MSSATKLDLIHAFGSTCSQKYINCVGICDEEINEAKIVFPIGKSLARKSIDRSEMDFVHFSQQTDHIQNICMLPTRSHVAVAYRAYNTQLQQIKIYSFKTEEQPISLKIFHQNQKIGQIKLLVFSPSEPKFMCTLLGQPHNKLLFVDTFKNKSLAESSYPLKDIDRLTICPSNSHLICVSGGNNLKLFKVQEYTFKPLEDIKKIPKGRKITTHAWYKRKMIIAATDKCEILVLQETKPNLFQIKQEYHNVFNQPKYDEIIVTVICPFSKGLILGSNNGKFCLWTKKEDSSFQGQEALQLTRKWATTAERASEVTNIQISLKEDIIVISLANNDIATLYINQLIPQVSDLLNELSEKQIIFQYLYKGFHNHPVTGMDICEQRPLIVTCSQMDSTIRVWNYKSYGCKLLRMFYFKVKEQFDCDKPLITLAFHPSGYYLAVGCIDKLRFFHVLNTELRPYRQLGVKNAQIVKFSRGGHLLAVSFPFRDQASSHHIKVFNSLTLEELIVFKDHNSPIRSLEFKKFDESLLSVSEEGSLVQWRLSDWAKTKSIIKKDFKYKCCIYSHSRNSIVAFGIYKGKRYLEEHGCQNNSVNQLEVTMDVVTMAQINIGKEKALLLSLECGKIVVYGGLQRPIIMDTRNYHLQRVTNIVLSPCGNFVMTSGQDCMVLIFKTVHQINGVIQDDQHTNITVDDFLADVVLINRKEIERVSQKEKQFSKVISNLSKKLKTLAEQGLKRHNARLLQVQLQKNRIIEDINYRIDRLKNQLQQLKSKTSVSIQNLDKNHLQKAQSIERSYQEKINFEIQKYFQLEQELIQIKMVHKKDMQQLKQHEEDQIAKLKADFQIKFKESQQIYSQSKLSSEKATNIFDQRMKQIEDEQEEEIRELQSKKHKFKLQTAGTLMQLFERQGKLKKQHAKLTDQRDEERHKNEQKLHNKRKNEKQVQEAKDKLKDMNASYNQKIEVLKVKQKRIVQFQNKIADLQKKKHILSYKGTQMKKAMEPKEMQIQKLKLDLIKLKKQFQLSLERKQKSILTMEKNQKQKINLQKMLEDEKAVTQAETETIDQIMTDVYHCLQTHKKVGDAKIFYKEFIKLYHRYINKNQKIEQLAETKGIQQLTKQVVHLEKSLYQINKGNQKNVARKNQEIFKRIKENTELVTNLNQIKKENKEILLRIKSKKNQIQKLKIVKNSLLAECSSLDNNTYKMFLQDDYIEAEKAPDQSRTSLVRNSSSKPNLLAQTTKEQTQDSKKSYLKMQCELISEIEFTNERIHKMQFFIKEMKEKIRRHLHQYPCSSNSFMLQEQINELKFS